MPPDFWSDAHPHLAATGQPPHGAFFVDHLVTCDEIDDFGHANNAAYHRWLDLSVWAHAEALGIGAQVCRRLGRGFAVVDAHLRYVAPALEHDAIRISTWITVNDEKLRGERCFTVATAEGTILARAVKQYIVIDLATLKPARMPLEFVTLARPLPSLPIDHRQKSIINRS
jgi:acyl-CoA thioester hydrolase